MALDSGGIKSVLKAILILPNSGLEQYVNAIEEQDVEDLNKAIRQKTGGFRINLKTKQLENFDKEGNVTRVVEPTAK